MNKKNIEKILTSKKLITEMYFELQLEFERKYGENSILLIEIGSFFEVYEVDNDEIKIGKAKEIAQILNIQLTKKNKKILENSYKNPLMAGIPSISLEKYIQKLTDTKKYTVVVIKQKGLAPNISRYIDKIVTPGTNFDYINQSDQNCITSLVIDKNSEIYSIGYTSIDVTTGRTSYCEIDGTKEDREYALDEVFNILHTYKSSEFIITPLDKSVNIDKIIQYLEIENYHINQAKLKIDYQNELFKNIYQIESILSPIEYLDLERNPMVSQSLAILIDFIISIDENVVKKLTFPNHINENRYIYLGNNAIKQLNIVDGETNIFKLMDNTSTSIGKRLLRERLLNPIKDISELNRRYDLSISLENSTTQIVRELKNIYDIERLFRRIKLQRLHPFEINHLLISFISIKKIIEITKKSIEIEPIEFKLNEFIEDIKSSFDLDISSKYTQQNLDDNIFLTNIDKNIDKLIDTNQKIFEELVSIKDSIETILKETTNSNGDNLILIQKSDKDGFYLQLTKNRFNLIKDKFLSSHSMSGDKIVLFKDFKIKTQTNVIKISGSIIDDISDKFIHNQIKLTAIVKESFIKKLSIYDEIFLNGSNALIKFISDIDVAISNINTSNKYGYVKPNIIENESNKNFLEIVGLRHPLIERLENTIYIKNDIILGDLDLSTNKDNIIVSNTNSDINGLLLYGINSSGKSSLMKSIGVNVLLAQAGLFVSCSSMRLTLFDSIFTRIVGNDDIARGLSSFAVEMIELKNIFNRATNKSLILGDEISHSTETLSGVSIVASAIIWLSKLKPIFIFTTHLHQLTTLDKIKEIKNIIALHLSIEYNEEKDSIIFDRKLKLGSGSAMYGLEFAKSLHMNQSFLDEANSIRKSISNDYSKLELLSMKKSSKYNKSIYVSTCAICESPVDDVHHISNQSSANKNGIIDNSFHKNHKHNLIPLCKKHHKMVHNQEIVVNGFITTSKGIELHYQIINN